MLCCNGVARKVAGRLQHVTCRPCNLSRNFSGLAKLGKAELVSIFCSDCRVYFLIDYKLQLKVATFNMSPATCNVFRVPTLRGNLHEKLHRVTSVHSVQSLQAQNRLRDNLQKGHISRCNLPATCLSTPLQDKLQE